MDLFILECESGLLQAKRAGLSLSGFRSGTIPLDTNGFEEAETTFAQKAPSVYYVRLWCRTREGESCLVVVRDPYSTFYRKLHPSASAHTASALADVSRRLVEKQMDLADGLRVEVVSRHTSNGWIPSSSDPTKPALFLWLRCRSGSPQIRAKLLYEGKGKGKGGSNLMMTAARELSCESLLTPVTAEKAIPLQTQLCQERGIRPGGWLHLSMETWAKARLPTTSGLSPRVGLLVHLSSGELSPAEVEFMPPVRVLSYDIETFSSTGGFPSPDIEEDVIITIGLHAQTIYAGDGEKNESSVALTLFSAPQVENGSVKCFPSEVELLLGFAQELRGSDADFLLGYNLVLFDNDYLARRASLLFRLGRLTKAQMDEAFCWSRLGRLPCHPAFTFIGSAAMGDNKVCRAATPGRIDLDLWFERKRANPSGLANYKLNTVAQFYLGESKHDLPPAEIFAKFREGTPEGRGIIASYCLQDCALVTKLVEKLDVVASTFQMAFIAGVTASHILWRGQGCKVMTLLVEEAHRQNYVLEDTGDAKGDHNNGDAPADEEKYEGATVLEPQAGMYLDPIVCLDFAALYPSLLRTFTGCVSTYVKDPGAIQTPTYTVPNTKHSFVTSEVTRGLIPRILDNLTLARQSAKRDMKNAPTPELRSLYNYRQLALKISANSIYGFTGCKRGQLSAVEVAESTTGLGRHVIELTAKYVERTYPGAKVVYGDTDSVFVRLPEEMRSLPVSDIFPLGHRWAKEVTTHIASTFPFRSYIELEFEKVLSPLILWRKKRYSGLCYEEPDTPTLLVKGIELVRRDSLPIVKTIQREILEKLLYSRDADGAQLLIKQAVDTVLAVPAGGPFDAVVQSKSLRGAYKNEEGMAHVQVKKLMDERSAGSGPKVGDRVSYIVCSSSATRIVDRAEDPAHASTIGLSIDYLHYVTAIETPLLRLVEIPLRQLSVGLYEGLEAFMVRALNRARAQCALATRCRVGTVWKDGHLAKDGLVQRTLVCSEPPAEIAAKRKRQKRDGSAVERGEQRPISDYFVKAPAPETATPLPPALPQ